jgi:transketolase
MFAAHNKLDNLCGILDYNKLQITGSNVNVMNLEPLKQKIESFGWNVREVDGHDIAALVEIMEALPFEQDKPSFIIAHTIKGKGVSFMEHQVKWHHGVPSQEQYEQAIQELELP